MLRPLRGQGVVQVADKEAVGRLGRGDGVAAVGELLGVDGGADLGGGGVLDAHLEHAAPDAHGGVAGGVEAAGALHGGDVLAAGALDGGDDGLLLLGGEGDLGDEDADDAADLDDVADVALLVVGPADGQGEGVGVLEDLDVGDAGAPELVDADHGFLLFLFLRFTWPRR